MEEIDLKDVFMIFWNKKVRIFFITIIFIALGVAYSYEFLVPEYTSSTTLVLTTSEGKTEEKNTITTTDITLNSKLVSTYSELLKSKNVVRQVISNLRMNVEEEELRKNISVNSVKGTELIQISVTNKDPDNASKIANEMAKVFTEKVTDIYNINNVHIVDPAEANTTPSNINHIKDIAVFSAIGLFIGMLSAYLSNVLDKTVKTAEQVEKKFKTIVLANTPMYKFNNSKKANKDTKISKELIAQRDPKSPVSEIFRTLRTNIQFMNTNRRLKTILVTSTFPGEGKSWISSNLAVTFAQAGKRVILIDADMRKGRLYNIFGISPTPGLSNILSEIETEEKQVDVANYIQETEIKNLLVIPSGNIPPNPSELLVSPQMRRLLDILRVECDIIIIDGTPCELVTDSVILSRTVDSTIIVTAHKKTKEENLERVIKNIKNVGGRLAGVVINKMPNSKKKDSDKYYYNDNSYIQNEKDNEIKENKNTEEISTTKEPEKVEIKIIDATENTEEIIDNKKQNEENEKIENTEQKENNEEIQNTEQKELEKRTNDILNQINSFLEQEKKELKE